LHEGEGIKEVTLLGQNNSLPRYQFRKQSRPDESNYAHERWLSQPYPTVTSYYFADLVEAVSDISPSCEFASRLRIPKIIRELLSLMAGVRTCVIAHMPAQSGSSTMLERMKRGYTRTAAARRRTQCHPDVAISSDFITGFFAVETETVSC
jgi:tRNA A37 methylthiotransferase MiaB